MFVICNGIQTEQGHSPTKYATSHWDKTHEASMLSWPVNLALVAHNGLAFSEKKAKRTALSYEYTQRYLRLQSYSRTNVNLRNQNDNVEKDYIILYSIEAPSKECWNLVLSLLSVGHDLKEMVYPFLKRSWNAMKFCDFLGENHGKSKGKKEVQVSSVWLTTFSKLLLMVMLLMVRLHFVWSFDPSDCRITACRFFSCLYPHSIFNCLGWIHQSSCWTRSLNLNMCILYIHIHTQYIYNVHKINCTYSTCTMSIVYMYNFVCVCRSASAFSRHGYPKVVRHCAAFQQLAGSRGNGLPRGFCQ